MGEKYEPRVVWVNVYERDGKTKAGRPHTSWFMADVFNRGPWGWRLACRVKVVEKIGGE